MSQTLAIIVCARSRRTVPSARSLGPEVKALRTAPAILHSSTTLQGLPWMTGDVIVADSDNHHVRKMTTDSTVSTLAGSGMAGFADDPGTAAQLNGPKGVAVDDEGNVIVVDSCNNRVRKIAPDGTVSTLSVSGSRGFVDGPGAVAQFDYPTGVAVDCDGGIIVTDYGNHRVRKIAPDGTVSTLAGSGRAGLADGPGADAQIFFPEGVSVDDEGNVILTDYGVGKKPVCKITPDGSVSTCFVGSCAFRGVVIDSEGCVVVSTKQHTVSKITGCCLARQSI